MVMMMRMMMMVVMVMIIKIDTIRIIDLREMMQSSGGSRLRVRYVLESGAELVQLSLLRHRFSLIGRGRIRLLLLWLSRWRWRIFGLLYATRLPGASQLHNVYRRQVDDAIRAEIGRLAAN